MAKPGPRPTPTEVKRLRGTLRAGSVAATEPRPDPAPLAMPPGVLPASARAVWRRLAPELQRLGLLTVVDVPLFTVTAIWAGVAVDAARLLREGGIIQQDDRGREAKARALSILRVASSELRQLSRCFGLSPADRQGIHVEPIDQEDDLVAILFRAIGVDEKTEGTADGSGSNG